MYDLLLLRWFTGAWGTIPRARRHRRARSARAVRALGSGHLVGLFPEGTRSLDGRVGDARPGAALLAALSGGPVVPAFIEGARDSMPIGARFPKPARIRVRFGPAIRFPAGGKSAGSRPARRLRAAHGGRDPPPGAGRMTTRRAETIAIGSELLGAERVDTTGSSSPGVSKKKGSRWRSGPWWGTIPPICAPRSGRHSGAPRW